MRPCIGVADDLLGWNLQLHPLVNEQFLIRHHLVTFQLCQGTALCIRCISKCPGPDVQLGLQPEAVSGLQVGERGWDAGSLSSDFTHYIPGTQDEPLGFASLASAARLMDEILTPIPIDLKSLKPQS